MKFILKKIYAKDGQTAYHGVIETKEAYITMELQPTLELAEHALRKWVSKHRYPVVKDIPVEEIQHG